MLRMTRKLVAPYQTILRLVMQLEDNGYLVTSKSSENNRLPLRYSTTAKITLPRHELSNYEKALLEETLQEEQNNAEQQGLLLSLLQSHEPRYLSTLMIHDWMLVKTKYTNVSMAQVAIVLAQLVATNEVESSCNNLLWRYHVHA